MKNLRLLKLYLLITLSLMQVACNDDDDNNTPTNPIDQLPPVTQTGE